MAFAMEFAHVFATVPHQPCNVLGSWKVVMCGHRRERLLQENFSFYRSSATMVKESTNALPITIPKSGEVQFSIPFLLMIHHGFANATQDLLC